MPDARLVAFQPRYLRPEYVRESASSTHRVELTALGLSKEHTQTPDTKPRCLDLTLPSLRSALGLIRPLGIYSTD